MSKYFSLKDEAMFEDHVYAVFEKFIFFFDNRVYNISKEEFFNMSFSIH